MRSLSVATKCTRCHRGIRVRAPEIPPASSSRSSIRRRRTRKMSGRWERPLKGVELGGLGTQVLVGIGARLVPLSGYGAPRYAGSSRARIVLLSLLVRMSRARGRLGRGSSRERSDACRGRAFRVLAADEHLELDPEREVGRERVVNDGVDDHTPETVSGAFLSQRLSEHSDLLSELVVLERIAALDR